MGRRLVRGNDHRPRAPPGRRTRRDLYTGSFSLLNSLISPWHQWLDPARYRRHVDSVADLHPDTVATAHGPLLRGDAIGDAFDRVRAMAANPRVIPPGQSALDELVAATVFDRADV